MPNYQFINTETGEIFTKSMKMSELDGYKINNPTHQIHFSGEAPPIGDPVRLGVRRIDNGFREVLSRISERTPGGKGLKDNIR